MVSRRETLGDDVPPILRQAYPETMTILQGRISMAGVF